MAVLPPETNPVLLIDTNAVLPPPVPPESPEPVPGRLPELPQFANTIDLVELPLSNCPDGSGTRLPCSTGNRAVEHIFGATIPERPYHGSHYNGSRYVCQDYRIGTVLGEARLNIAHIAWGRDVDSGEAFTLINLDSPGERGTSGNDSWAQTGAVGGDGFASRGRVVS
jgi:hypothetical protein